MNYYYTLQEGERLKDNIAAQMLTYNNLWEKTDKSVIANNVEKYLYRKHPECSGAFEIKMNKLEEITGSKRQTVYAWLNRSRERVKVPFLKLCVIAIALDVDIADLLKAEG